MITRRLNISGRAWNRLKQKWARPYHIWRGREIVHHLHIGKTAGTAAKTIFEQCPVTARYVVHGHSHSYRLRDVPPGDKVVFFLRDPIDRFVSGFYSRRREGRPRLHIPWSEEERAAFEHFETPNQLALALSSADRAERERAERAMNGIKHVQSSYWDWFDNEAYLRSRWSDVLFVGFQESFDRDMARLQALLGIPAHVKPPTDDVAAHRNPENVDRSLEPKAVENLRNWYRNDYDFLRICRSLMEAAPGDRD